MRPVIHCMVTSLALRSATNHFETYYYYASRIGETARTILNFLWLGQDETGLILVCPTFAKITAPNLSHYTNCFSYLILIFCRICEKNRSKKSIHAMPVWNIPFDVLFRPNMALQFLSKMEWKRRIMGKKTESCFLTA